MLRLAAALAVIPAVLITCPLSAQAGGGGGTPKTSSSSSSSSHRVVVVNGKKVVDEKIVDGQRVPSGSAGSSVEVELMMREMAEMMRRHGIELPDDWRGGLPGKASGSHSSSSSSSHRVVVVNGKKVVDDKIVDGKRVPSGGGPRGGRGVSSPDLEDMIREMEEQMKKRGIDVPLDWRRGLPGKSDSSSGSSGSGSSGAEPRGGLRPRTPLPPRSGGAATGSDAGKPVRPVKPNRPKGRNLFPPKR